MDNTGTLGILRQLERGEISASEADTRLTTPPRVERVAAPPFDQIRLPAWLHRIWITLLIAGTAVVMLGAWIIAATVHTNAFLWLLFGVPFVLIGSLLLAMGAGGFSGHWVYIHIESSRKRRHALRFALPFPLGLVRLGLWIARFVQPHQRARVHVNSPRSQFNALWDDPDEFMRALERELAEGRGITVDVDSPGERVQVYIV